MHPKLEGQALSDQKLFLQDIFRSELWDLGHELVRGNGKIGGFGG